MSDLLTTLYTQLRGAEDALEAGDRVRGRELCRDAAHSAQLLRLHSVEARLWAAVRDSEDTAMAAQRVRDARAGVNVYRDAPR